jgi:hypothetical protein
MPYATGSIVVNAERDIPLLRQVRNSKFVSRHQLFEFMKLGGFDHSPDCLNWRLRRLLNSGHISICQGVCGAGSAVYRVTKHGIVLLEHHGQFTTVLNSNTEHLPHISQVFHALELNAVWLALLRANMLAGWQAELEISSFNTISCAPYQKDYDAIVDVWIGERTARFALEYERTLKSRKRYEYIRASLEAEQQVEFILYLTSGMEILVYLLREFRAVRKKLAFADATSFERNLLDTMVTGSDGITVGFRELLQQKDNW